MVSHCGRVEFGGGRSAVAHGLETDPPEPVAYCSRLEREELPPVKGPDGTVGPRLNLWRFLRLRIWCGRSHNAFYAIGRELRPAWQKAAAKCAIALPHVDPEEG